MRHAIDVVCSKAQSAQPLPHIALRNDEPFRRSTWYANTSQSDSNRLLDDVPGIVTRLMLATVLAYRFYLLVQNTKMWSGKRPLLLVRGRSLASRVAAYAGTWGGGDVVKADLAESAPLGPTRYVLTADGDLQLHDGSTSR